MVVLIAFHQCGLGTIPGVMCGLRLLLVPLLTPRIFLQLRLSSLRKKIGIQILIQFLAQLLHNKPQIKLLCVTCRGKNVSFPFHFFLTLLAWRHSDLAPNDHFSNR